MKMQHPLLLDAHFKINYFDPNKPLMKEVPTEGLMVEEEGIRNGLSCVGPVVPKGLRRCPSSTSFQLSSLALVGGQASPRRT